MSERGTRVSDAAANLVAYFASVVVAIAFTPYLVRSLGVEYFGLVPIATSATQYMSVLTVAVQGAVGRGVIAALSRGERERAVEIWNASLVALVGLCVTALPLALVASESVANLFRVPLGAEVDLRHLLVATFTGFFVTSLAGLFEVGIYAKSRFDLRAFVLVGATVTRVCVTVVLFETTAPRLWHVGAGILAAACVQLGLACGASRRVAPEIIVRPGAFRWEVLRDLYRIGAWIVVNHLGALLFLNANVIVVNLTLGPRASGEFGLVMTWVNFLVGVGSAVAGVYGPTLIADVARADRARTVGHAKEATRVVAVAMSLPIGLVVGCATPLMAAWQGEAFAHLGPLLALSVVGFSVSIGAQPLGSIFLATTHVRVPGLVGLVSGVVSVGMGYALVRHTSLHIYAPALVSTVTMVFTALFFTGPYGAWCIETEGNSFTWTLLTGGASALMVAGVAWGVCKVIQPSGWLWLGVAGTFAALIAVPLAGAAFLSAEERAGLLGAVRGRFGRPGRPHRDD